MSFTAYDPSNAPENARPVLQKAESAYGFVPNILGVLTGIAMKTLSNYTNHIADTPLDSQFGG